MRTIHTIAAGACAFALAGACGGMSGSPEPAIASRSDVVQYNQLALQVQSAAGAYGNALGRTNGTTIASCQSVEDQYDGQVRPWVSQMRQMSGAMDDLAAAHDGAMHADMGCDANAMLHELDHYRSVACASSDLATDRAEAARHVQAMMGYTSHATERCGELLAGLDRSDWNFSPMMSGCNGVWAGGEMMPGGGTMGSH
jgi:hypothetical protein